MAKESPIYQPVSHVDSIGQQLVGFAKGWRITIIVLFIILGVVLGVIWGKEGWPLACAVLGAIGGAIGSIVVFNVTLFIEAKAELLINTAKIQEDLEYLCKAKEFEIAAQQRAAANKPANDE